MTAGLGYRKLVDDFIVDDRRLGDRPDIQVNFVTGPLDEINRQSKVAIEAWQVNISLGRWMVSFRTSNGNAALLECCGNQRFTPDQERLFSLLGGMVRYFELSERDRRLHGMLDKISRKLKEIRESLGLSQAAIALQAHTTLISVSRWESGTEKPPPDSLYDWCQALGLVCPPKTALVHIVDFSPDLLRLLQEDPTRLRSLTPDQFERFVAERLDRMGYNVTLTGPTNRKDGGIDLIAVPKLASLGSYVIAGQAKHHRGDQTTGVDAVDRLLAWKDSVFRAGLLVTNTAFTNDAVWKAGKDGNVNFLRLRDFTDLKRWLEGQFGGEEDWREIPDRIELAPGVVIEIPKPKIVSPFNLKD